MTTGQKIEAARKEKGWNVEQLAVYSNVSSGTVRRIEADKEATVTKLLRVIRTLGMDVEDAFGDGGDAQKGG